MKQHRYKSIFYLLMHAAFALLFIASFIFHRERLIGNGGQDLFSMINRETFFLIHGRLTHVFSQWMPLLAMKFGASLKTISILFSISTILTYYVIFLIILYKLKKPYIAFAVLLVPIFGVSYSFFHDPHLEIQYAMVLSILLYAVIDSEEIKIVPFTLSSTALIVFAVLSYPPTVLFPAMVFILKWSSMNSSRRIVLAVLLLMVPVIAYFSLDPYESGVVSYSLRDEGSFSYFTTLSKFFGYFARYNIVEVVILLFTSLALIRMRHYYSVMVGLLSLIAYASLVVVFYGNNFQFEHKSLPLMFFIIVMAIYTIRNSGPKVSATLISLSFLVLISRSAMLFTTSHKEFAVQIDSLEAMSQQLDCRDKQLFIIEDAEEIYSHTSFQMSLLLSSLDKQENTVGILFEHILVEMIMSWQVGFDEHALRELIDGDDHFALTTSIEANFDEMSLNDRYFPIRDRQFEVVSVNALCPASIQK